MHMKAKAHNDYLSNFFINFTQSPYSWHNTVFFSGAWTVPYVQTFPRINRNTSNSLKHILFQNKKGNDHGQECVIS